IHLVHPTVADHNEKRSKVAAGCPYERNTCVVSDGTDGAGPVELMNFGAIRVTGSDRNHRLIGHGAEDLQALGALQHNRLFQANGGHGRTVVTLRLTEN